MATDTRQAAGNTTCHSASFQDIYISSQPTSQSVSSGGEVGGDNTTCSQSVKPIWIFFLQEPSPKSYIQLGRDEWEWECLPLKSSLLWPNHMLSLLSFRRPALFIKALDGYLSQHCRIHSLKLPSLLTSLPLSNLFLLPSNVSRPPPPLPRSPPPSILPFPLSLIHPSLLNQTLKSLKVFFCLCMCDSTTVKVDETRRIQIHHSCNPPW